MLRFAQDFRYGLRMLVKHPGLAAISIFALALGIGLTTTMWSINYGALLRGLPFENDEELVHITRTRPSRGVDRMGVPIHDFEEWRRAQTGFAELAAFYDGTVNVSSEGNQPERFEGSFMTPGTFRLLRVNPLLGRTFTDEEGVFNGPHVVVIGWEIWQQRFGGDSSIVGRTIRANGNTVEVIGVMPRGFAFPDNSRLWLPLRIDPATPWGQGQWLGVLGRLRQGVALEAATREMEVIAARVAQEHPEQNEGVSARLESFIDRYIPEEPRLMLWTMMGAVLGVLLIACSNVANLLLARAAIRTKEVAIRTALGASRGRIMALMLTEALVLSAAGAVLGTALAWVGIRTFNNAIASTEPPFFILIRLDAPILLFVLGITVLAAVVAGIVPALQTTRTDLNDVLKDESRGSSSLRLGKFSKALVVAEMALSCGLLVGAGFMIQSVVQFGRVDHGVPTDDVFTARIGLFEANYPARADRDAFWREVERRLETLPGQRGVALTTVLPGLTGWNQALALDGVTYETDRDYPRVRRVAVSPGYFGAFRLNALEGRLFTAGDIDSTLPAAIVTRDFAAAHFGGESPLGRRIRLGGAQTTEPWLTIVGVVPPVWYRDNDGEGPSEVVMTPLAQADYRFVSVAIAAEGRDAMTFAEPVRQAVVQVDRDQPIYFARTLREAIRQNGWFYSVFGTLFAVFGVAALVLAVIGVYGVMSFAVTRRTQEVGVRMALGASGSDVLALFMRQGFIQVASGVVIGTGLAFLLGQGLSAVLFDVNTRNPLMFAGVGSALALTGLVASFIPARRATRVDPMVAIRYE
jgi:putative ABC transport system permease protein